MTVTVKLPEPLEQALRQRSAALGQTTSEVIREALTQYLETSPPSAYSLGQDLFGRHAGPSDLASRRKADVADLWEAKHRARSARSRHG